MLWAPLHQGRRNFFSYFSSPRQLSKLASGHLRRCLAFCFLNHSTFHRISSTSLGRCSTTPRTFPSSQRSRTTQQSAHPHGTHSFCVDRLHTCLRHGRGEHSRVNIHSQGARQCQRFTTPAPAALLLFFLALGDLLCPTIVWSIRQGTVSHPGASGRGVGGHQAVSQKPPLDKVVASEFFRCLHLFLPPPLLGPFRYGTETAWCVFECCPGTPIPTHIRCSI